MCHRCTPTSGATETTSTGHTTKGTLTYTFPMLSVIFIRLVLLHKTLGTP